MYGSGQATGGEAALQGVLGIELFLENKRRCAL